MEDTKETQTELNEQDLNVIGSSEYRGMTRQVEKNVRNEKVSAKSSVLGRLAFI